MQNYSENSLAWVVNCGNLRYRGPHRPKYLRVHRTLLPPILSVHRQFLGVQGTKQNKTQKLTKKKSPNKATTTTQLTQNYSENSLGWVVNCRNLRYRGPYRPKYLRVYRTLLPPILSVNRQFLRVKEQNKNKTQKHTKKKNPNKPTPTTQLTQNYSENSLAWVVNCRNLQDDK